jgi:hypothetical protein
MVDDGVVMKAPLGGGSPEVLASGQGRPNCIAVDDANVYWTNLGGGTITKIPIEGGTPMTLASGQHGPGGIAVDGKSVYWTTYGDVGNDGTVMKLTPK